MRSQLVALERWAFRVTSCCDDVVAKRSYNDQVVLADLILLQTVRDAVGMLLFCSGAHDHRHVYDSREALLTIAHQEHPQCGA